MIVQQSDFKLLAKWRAVSRFTYTAAAALFRSRYEERVHYFVDDIPLFDAVIRTHGAIISGSVALRFFLPEETWPAEDMDVYVPDIAFDHFITVISDPSGLNFKLIPRSERTDRARANEGQSALTQPVSPPPQSATGEAGSAGDGDGAAAGGHRLGEFNYNHLEEPWSSESDTDEDWIPYDASTNLSTEDEEMTDVDETQVSDDDGIEDMDLERPLSDHNGIEDMDLETPTPGDTPEPSFSQDIINLLQFKTPKEQYVDVIRSPTNNPVVAINRFWSSLVMNFLTPDSCVCGFPNSTLSRIAMLKPDLVPRDNKAIVKYIKREFKMSDTMWRDGIDYCDTLFFGHPMAMVYSFHLNPTDKTAPLPIGPSRRGWLLNALWPYPVCE